MYATSTAAAAAAAALIAACGNVTKYCTYRYGGVSLCTRYQVNRYSSMPFVVFGYYTYCCRFNYSSSTSCLLGKCVTFGHFKVAMTKTDLLGALKPPSEVGSAIQGLAIARAWLQAASRQSVCFQEGSQDTYVHQSRPVLSATTNNSHSTDSVTLRRCSSSPEAVHRLG